MLCDNSEKMGGEGRWEEFGEGGVTCMPMG